MQVRQEAIRKQMEQNEANLKKMENMRGGNDIMNKTKLMEQSQNNLYMFTGIPVAMMLLKWFF